MATVVAATPTKPVVTGEDQFLVQVAGLRLCRLRLCRLRLCRRDFNRPVNFIYIKCLYLKFKMRPELKAFNLPSSS
jgi:hypothetical protein